MCLPKYEKINFGFVKQHPGITITKGSKSINKDNNQYSIQHYLVFYIMTVSNLIFL